MKSTNFAVKGMTLAVGSALFALSQSVVAQTAAQDKPALNLEEIVVTATATSGSKMKQSVSVSTLDSEQILKNQPTNAADVLRSIPGIRSESSGGGGNANVTVRGLPISAGGSRYVQFQEDGLPVLLFGDIAFATPDMFIRADGSLDRLEVVRGGSASTLATNSPGGVINFISKTGEDQGGSVALTKGLGFDRTRLDFDYGGKISDKTRFFVGGYYNTGEGPREAVSSAEQGHQIRANITHKLDNGYIRLNLKSLDDKSPLFMPAPVSITNGKISELPGIDPRTYTGYSSNWVSDMTLSKNNTLVASNVNDGLRVKANAIGLEGSFNVGNGWNVTGKFRTAEQSGRFIGLFPADNVSAAAAGTTYATGPLAGRSYTGNAFTQTVFNTSLDNLNATTLDVKAAKTWDLGGSKVTTTAGLFNNVQHVALTWNFNQYLMQATGNNPALLRNGTTNAYGLIAQGTDVWGGCCNRAIDATYRTTSPYFAVAYESGPINLDASVRRDSQSASGSYTSAANQQFSLATTKAIDYSKDHTSFSLGGNYRLNKDTALFLRYSEGAAFNADRIMFGSTALAGGSPIPLNTVKQLEGGVKWRSGNLNTFVTLFNAKTKESNYDATTQRSTANSYDAKGVEVEAGYRIGGFRIAGGLTYTDAKITDSLTASLVGTTPNRQAKLIYQLSPTYSMGDLTVGANVFATTKSKDAQGTSMEATLPAYTVVNAFANYRLGANAVVSLGVYNLFNTLGYTESNDGRAAARSINGRTAQATLRYMF